MVQVQFYDTDPRQFLAECNMPAIPAYGDTIELLAKRYGVLDMPNHWKIVQLANHDLIWVVEVSVIQDRGQ